MERLPPLRRWKTDRRALAVASVYLAVSLAWIWGSDWLVDRMVPDEHTRSFVHSSKGTAFVCLTALALYAAIAAGYARERRLMRDKRLVEEMLAVSQRLEALGTLAGTLVHDFNNVLTVIRTQTEVMRLDGFSPENLPEQIGSIEAATQRADRMVRDLMNFMQRSPTLYASADLGAAVQRCLTFLQNAAGRAVEVTLEMEAPLPLVPFEPAQLEQTLLNLVLNARDAMETSPEKRIRIHLRRTKFQRYQSLFRQKPVTGEFVAVSVADTGTGIARENFARIFIPFFTTKAPGKGTGLGLASVLRAVEAHGGWVELESELGRGARFTMYFPTEAVARRQFLDSSPPMS